MQDTILYFGSFNPVHRGHIAIAQYMTDKGYGDVWMVVSPQNPLKDEDGLASGQARLDMVEIAIGETGNQAIRTCNIEFHLPRPSYTIDTLDTLSARYPERRFAVLTGSDILPELERWKEYQRLLDSYTVWVYPRRGIDARESKFAARIRPLPDDAPLLEYSSTEIRDRLLDGEDCSSMLSPGVLQYITSHGLYRTPAAYVERGRRHFHHGDFGAAMNDFASALELDPDYAEAREYADMIKEILNFRNTDIYNP